MMRKGPAVMRYGVVLIAVLAASCGSSPSAPTPPTQNPPSSPSGSFTLNGRIVGTVTGVPIAGATVAVGGQTFTTDADGAFTLTDGTQTVRDIVVAGCDDRIEIWDRTRHQTELEQTRDRYPEYSRGIRGVTR